MRNLLLLTLLTALTAFLPDSPGTGVPTTGILATGAPNATITVSKAMLQDKIKGGWAGQVIGCTFGGPTEFKFQGTMINQYQPIPWYDGYIKKTMTETPGLYDDLYMDLTFVDVFEKEGIDAPVASHAKAYANAGYMLWHANQAGRYNILHGVNPPESGHWQHNPHADCIDFQIEADFSGLMAPGMPNTAAKIGDPIGHIMNYGDGWYGGVYVGAMYSLAFVSGDINYVVTEALKTIPAKSTFYQCMTDVIRWHKQYPDDWKRSWFELQKKWTDDVGCPDGALSPFDIDAKLNSAYIVLGLLYGNGDFSKTMDVSTRAGQDSDCNPSSAGGILGTMLGYNKMPAYWKQGLAEAEDLDFKYTTMSLNDVYGLGLKHALQVVERNGGRVNSDQVTIAVQTPTPVRLEQSFPNLYPIERRWIGKEVETEYSFDINGVGFVLAGEAKPRGKSAAGATTGGDGRPFVFTAELSVDDKPTETIKLPANFTQRRTELGWAYQLPRGKHRIKLRLVNPDPDHLVYVKDLLVYDNAPYHPR